MATQQQQQAFIQAAMPLALQVAQQTGIDPRVVIAQAALESNWGTAAPQNNYFGIKGGGASLPTSEFINGKEVPVNANFAAYPDMAGSFQGYGNLMNTNYYAPVRNAQGLDAQIAALGKSGYATEPDYAQQVASIAHNLPPIPPADVGGGTQIASATPPLPNLSPADSGGVFNFGNPTLPNLAGLNLGLQLSPQVASFNANNSLGLVPPTLANYASANPVQSSGAITAPTSLATPATNASADTLSDPFQKPSTVNFIGSSGAGGFTPAEASGIPPGPYGSDALVRAALSGDPTAIQNAENAIMSAAVQQEGLFGIDKAQANIQNYINTLTQQDPGTIRQLQTVLNNNPSLQSLIPPQLQPLVTQAFNALPPSPTAQIPLPQIAPPYTGTNSPPLVASNNSAPQPQLASFNTSQPWSAPPPPQSFIPESDYSAAQSGFVPESDYQAAQSGAFLPPVGTSTPDQVGTYLPPGSPTVPDFSQFNNPLPQLGSTTPDWSSTPYGANPDYGSVASTIGNAVGGGLSSLFGGSADATTSSAANNPLFSSGSLYDTPVPLSGGTPTTPDTTAYLNTPPANPWDVASLQPSPQSSSWDAGLSTAPLQYAAYQSTDPAVAPSSFNPPNGTIPSLYGGFAMPTYNVQQSFSPATQAILASQKPISFATQPQFAALAANPLNSFAFNSFAGKLPTSFPGFGGTSTVAAAPRPTWIPRPAAATAPPPPPVHYTDPTTGQLLTPSQQAFANQYGAPLQNVNWNATLAPDPYSVAAPGTYVLNDLGSNGMGGASGNDYSIPGGNGF